MADSIVLRGGIIHDGTGAAPQVGSLVVRGDRIVGRGADVEDASYIDLAGMVVAPGFIDMHTHSDVSVLSDLDCVSAVAQGVTTQIVGHCGFSAAPTDATTRSSLVSEEPIFGFPPGEGHPSGQWGWSHMADYLEALARARPRTNVGSLVGHGSLRRMVVGSSSRPATPSERSRMERLVGESLDGGALGVSSGLSYAPGMYADLDELAGVAGVAAQRGRRYHTHMRYGEASVRMSLQEAIETGRLARCRVNVSHLYPSATDPPDEAARLLEMVDAAAGEEEAVTFDLTLFRRGGGAWLQSLPGWAREGGVAATVETIRDPFGRSRLLDHLRRTRSGTDWTDVLVVKVNREENSGLVGRSIAAIATDRGVEPEEAALMLVEEDGQFWVAPTIKRQDDLDLLISHPACVPVTDGMAAHPVRHAGLGLMPKTFGTFPLLLGDYVRQRRVLGLPEAIRRITGLPAARLGLSDRGVLAEGRKADVVVFDPMTVANRATDRAPGTPPAGIHHVMVNGVWALWDGRLTPHRRGEVIR